MARPSQKKERVAEILEAAVTFAEVKPFVHLTRTDIARTANISPALLSHYFDTMGGLRDAIVHEGVKRKFPNITAQAIVLNHPAIDRLSEYEKRAALLYALDSCSLMKIGFE